jgi:hypothetical protein
MLHLLFRILEIIFFVGLAGSTVVVILTFFVDLRDFSRKD